MMGLWTRGLGFRAVASGLEDLAFGALILLGLSSAFEQLLPLLNPPGGAALSSTRTLTHLAVGLWLLACLAAGRSPRLPQRVALPALIWLAALLASAVAARHRPEALAFFAHLLGGVLTGWAAYDLARTFGRRRALAQGLALGGVAVAAVGLAEAADVGGVAAALAQARTIPTSTVDVFRVSSTFGGPNIAAMMLELTLPLVLAWALTARHRRLRVLLGGALVAGLATLVLTFSRAGLLALGASLGLVAYLAARRRQRPMLRASLAATGILGALLALLAVADPMVGRRLASEAGQPWYRAAYEVPEVLTASPGELLTIRVRLTNAGEHTWRAAGPQPTALSYHLSRADDGALVTYEGRRTPLRDDLVPGATRELQVLMLAPSAPGEYLLEWDGVHEGVAWFSLRGTPPARTRLTVTGSPPARPEPLASAAPTDLDGFLPPPGRLQLWQVALRMALGNPLLGVGPDNFRWQYGQYAGVQHWNATHAHNILLQWLAETGIVGLLAFLWFTWRAARVVARSLGRDGAPSYRGSEPSDPARVWQLALAASLVAWFVHGLLDDFYAIPATHVVFWLIVGSSLRTAEPSPSAANRVKFAEPTSPRPVGPP